MNEKTNSNHLNKISVAASRARVNDMITELERAILSQNIRLVRTSCQALRSELIEKSQLAALEGGAVQALVGSLNYAKKDYLVTEIVLSAISSLGRRPHLSTGSVAVANFLKIEGLSKICKAALEHKQSIKIRALTLKVLLNCSSDELGARVLINSEDTFAFLFDTLNKFANEHVLVVNVLSVLSNCCLFHLPARHYLINLESNKEIFKSLITISRHFKNNPEVIEQVLCLFCLLSTSKLGVQLLLNFSHQNATITCESEVICIALEALNSFATRSSDKIPYREELSSQQEPASTDADSSHNSLFVGISESR